MTPEHLATVARMKRRFILWVALLLGVATAINGVIYAQVQDQQRQLEASVTDIKAGSDNQVRQTLTGCQRGNELRRAVAVVAAKEGARIDPDATTITSCRRSVITITGIDPGPVTDYVEATP